MSESGLKLWESVEVKSLAGSRANERPISILRGRDVIEIRRILASWREPDHLYFKVEAEDGRICDLRHHEYEDYWQMRAFE